MEKRQKSWSKQEDAALWRMFYCDGLTQKQIGERLNRTINSVQRRLFRLRNKNFKLANA